MDGRIVHCGIISSCQSAATSEIARFWPRVSHVSRAIASIGLYLTFFYLNENFADVFAVRHEPEGSLDVVSLKDARLQWLHRAVPQTTRHQVIDTRPVCVARLKQRVQQHAVKRYVAQEYRHT